MSTGFNRNKSGCALALSVAVLCAGAFTPANAAPAAQDTVAPAVRHTVRKAKAKAKKPELPPLPSGPTGPVQPMPLDAIAAVPPQVTYQNSQLTIVAPNSTLSEILRAVRKCTGAEIEIPTAQERVVTHLGPGPARDVIADLLNGSRFNYVLLGAPGDDTTLTRVVLVPKSTSSEAVASNTPNPASQPGAPQMNSAPPQTPEVPEASNDAEQVDENNAVEDSGADQAASDSSEQPANSDQPQVKTPQQMLQEMQQRQMQLQQQGQQPVPNAPPRAQER